MTDSEKNHRKMWQWIAEETRRRKRHVEKFECYIAFGTPKRERPYCDCYACEEGRQRARDDGYDVDYADLIACCYCPIDWNNGKKCVEGGTLYFNWRHARSYEEAAKFAEKIARLEWKDKGERTE